MIPKTGFCGILRNATQDPATPGDFASPFAFAGSPEGISLGLDLAVADLDGDNVAEILATAPEFLAPGPGSVYRFELCQ